MLFPDGHSAMADDPRAEQNRRKLAAHLEALAREGGGRQRRKPASTPDPAGTAPPPPPKPPGWEAWKRAHAGRLHTVRYVEHGVDDGAAAADYALLGLKPGASRDAVRRSFRRLARQHHPDHGGDAEVFAALRAAYKRIAGAEK
jgi:DnaJ-domain-containing protein 1